MFAADVAHLCQTICWLASTKTEREGTILVNYFNKHNQLPGNQLWLWPLRPWPVVRWVRCVSIYGETISEIVEDSQVLHGFVDKLLGGHCDETEISLVSDEIFVSSALHLCLWVSGFHQPRGIRHLGWQFAEPDPDRRWTAGNVIPNHHERPENEIKTDLINKYKQLLGDKQNCRRWILVRQYQNWLSVRLWA